MASSITLDEKRPAAPERLRRPGSLRQFYADHDMTILGATAVVLFLLFWQWVGTSGIINPLFSSAPSRIIAAFQQLAHEGLGADVVTSAVEFAEGFGLALAIGIPLGILMGWYRSLEAILEPFVNLFNATPTVALTPIMIIWLGIGQNSKIAIVFLGAIFALLINTTAGVKNLDAALIAMARSFDATSLQIFRTIALPGAVPYILSGIRLGIGHALVGIVVGELYGASAGLGYLIAIGGTTFQTDKVMVGVVIIAAAGVLLTGVSRRVERHFQAWRPSR